jgi:hypothetical protein
MLLADWLRQDHRLGDQLPLMDSLCRAVTGAHRRAPARALCIDPTKITVAGGADCHIPDGVTPTTHQAPESLPGAPPSLRADIYSLGVIFYQMLARRHPAGADAGRSGHGEEAPPPTPLRDVRPDVPRDLADAITACLEADPEWRPKDLEYLLSTVRRMAVEHPPSEPSAVVRAEPAAAPAAALQAPRKRGGPPARSSPVLLIVLVVGLLAAAGAGWYFTRQPVPPEVEPGPTPLPVVSALPSTPPVETAAPPSPSPLPTASPSRRPGSPSPVASGPAPVPSPSRGAAAPPVVSPATAPTAPPPTPVPSPSAEPTPPPPPPSAAPAEPAVLTTLSPPRVKRPGNAIVDVRGTGLRPDLVARIVRGREAAAGVQIVRQRFVSPTLIQVVLRLEDAAAPGTYQLYLSDGGTNSNARALEITK